MAYYLGIDGGGSKTTCVVGDEMSEIATVTTGPSNITRVGEAGAREALQRAIHQACGAAKINPQQVQHACIGVAGAGRKEIADTVRKMVGEIIPGQIEVVGDMEIALAAAFGEDPGVIVIAGTGSIAYGRDAQGRTARAGGWGFAISDEGSAHWIGRTAVSALLRAIDQEEDARHAAEASSLARELKAAWNSRSIDELVRAANSDADFEASFPAVVSAANNGDAQAQRALSQAGRELAQLAGIVASRLFAEDRGGLSFVPLAMVGGVFRHSPTVREVFRDEVHKLDAGFELNLQIVDPVVGALRKARKS